MKDTARTWRALFAPRYLIARTKGSGIHIRSLIVFSAHWSVCMSDTFNLAAVKGCRWSYIVRTGIYCTRWRAGAMGRDGAIQEARASTRCFKTARREVARVRIKRSAAASRLLCSRASPSFTGCSPAVDLVSLSCYLLSIISHIVCASTARDCI